MLSFNKFTKWAFVGAIPAVLLACSHTPPIQEISATANPAEVIQSLDSDMSQAYRNQVDILSPNNYERASASLKEAKSDLDQQKDSAKVLHEVAVGRAYLTQAESVAAVAHANLDDVIQARGQAIAAGAAQHYQSEFADVDHNLRSVTKEIEQNDLSSVAPQRAKLQTDYLAIELKSIKVSNLNEANSLIQKSIQEDAKKFAPRSLAIAERDYHDAEAYITANRHGDGVKDHAAQATASANHLLTITRASKSDKKSSSEELALQMEQSQQQVANQKSDLQDKQSELRNQDAVIANRESKIKGQDAQLRNSAQALNESESKADATAAFNQKYESARGEFNDNEAEVYKQGDDLVIRLKTLDFSSAKSDLKGTSFPVLAKVAGVIKSFGGSSVIVEGHTDSVGGKAINEKLSTERAEVVREYFISNAVTTANRITAVGYGYQKPLASNKTTEGRAENRRVDIRIQPEKSTDL